HAAHIAESDARKLYLPAAYPSMFAYCVQELRLSEDAAYNRIRPARLARQFPGIFEAVADGRLHLGAIGLLAPYLTPENAEELLLAASHRTKSEIEELLAHRFPRAEAMGLVMAVPALPARTGESPVPERVEGPGRPASQLAPGRVGTRVTLAPVAPERYLLEVTVGRNTHDKLQYAKDLLGHQVPSGDLARVLDRALDALIERLEKRKFAATARPRRSARPSAQ